MNIVELPTLESVSAFARLFATKLPRGEFVGLSGELGTGKTTFVQELLRALDYDGEVLSPTYTLEHIYPLKDGTEVHHWDLYRLSEDSDWNGLQELQGNEEAIILIEWPERISQIMSLLKLHLQFEYAGEGRRMSYS